MELNGKLASSCIRLAGCRNVEISLRTHGRSSWNIFRLIERNDIAADLFDWSIEGSIKSSQSIPSHLGKEKQKEE